MPRSVTVAGGYTNVELPNGASYNAGATVILTDDEWAQVSSSNAVTDGVLIDNGDVEAGDLVTVQGTHVAAPAALTSSAPSAETATAPGALTSSAPAAVTATNAAGGTPTADEFDAAVTDITALQADLTDVQTDLAAMHATLAATVTDIGTLVTELTANHTDLSAVRSSLASLITALTGVNKPLAAS